MLVAPCATMELITFLIVVLLVESGSRGGVVHMKFGPPGRPLTVTFATVTLLVGVPYLQFKLLRLLAPLLTRLLPPKAFCSPRPTGVLVAPAFAVVPVRAH